MLGLPPPLRLSRGQIEALRAAKRRNSEDHNSQQLAGNGNSPASSLSSPSQRTSSYSPNSAGEVYFFSRGEHNGVPSPIRATPSSPLNAAPRESSISVATRIEAIKRKPLPPLPPGFCESPRKAPLPPKESSKQTKELPLPPAEGSCPLPPSPPPQIPLPRLPEHGGPEHGGKLPLRVAEQLPRRNVMFQESNSMSSESSFGNASSKMVLPHLPVRYASGEPVESHRHQSSQSNTAPHATAQTKKGPLKRAAAQIAKGGKRPTVKKRMGDNRSSRSVLYDIDETGALDPAAGMAARLAESDAEMASSSSSSATEILPPWRRGRRNEAMRTIYGCGVRPSQGCIRKHNPPAMNAQEETTSEFGSIAKDLPITPPGSDGAASELRSSYSWGSGGLGELTRREVYGAGMNRRRQPTTTSSPCASGSFSDTKSDSSCAPFSSGEFSSYSLPETPELTSRSDNSPHPLDLRKQDALKMQRQVESTAKLTPPNLKAWKRPVYVQGPMRLPNRAAGSQKGSTSFLEQNEWPGDRTSRDVVDGLTPGSEDSVGDDLCEFFDDFGLADVNVDSDDVSVPESLCADETEIVEEDSERLQTSSFAPVLQAEVSPHREVARASSWGVKHMQPLEEQRKDAWALARNRDELKTSSLLPGDTVRGQTANQGFDWDDDIENTDHLSSNWAASAAVPKKASLSKGLAGRDTRNPVKRVRRFIATASAIL